MSAAEIIRAERLSVEFTVGGRWRRRRLRAVDSVELGVREGEVLALVGESGSGKTTLGRALLRLLPASAGAIRFQGADITRLEGAPLRALRRQMQIVFQDPHASLDPRMTVGEIVREGLRIHAIGSPDEQRARVAALLEQVGLDPCHADRHPHALSGGQRQRVGIARALAVEPRFIVADEPVSSLDVSIQAQILALLAGLRARLGLTLLFITHNLGVVRQIADRVAVMYLGRVVEVGPTAQIFSRPLHPYTRSLLAAVPLPDPRRRRVLAALPGEPPSPLDPPSGCAFRSRCPHAVTGCGGSAPPLTALLQEHSVACGRAAELQSAELARSQS